MASTGSTYFIAKYKLARDGIAALDAPPCSHQEASYEGLMSTPYGSVVATTAAKADLKKLTKVNGKEVRRVGVFLEKRREDMKRTQNERRQNGADDEHAVSPRVNINLRVPNSTLSPHRSTQAGPSTSTRRRNDSPAPNSRLATPGPSRTGPPIPVRRQRVNLVYRDSILTPPRVSQDGLSPIAQGRPASPASAELQNSNKRKWEGLFDLEPASKRPHLGHCRPVPDHVAAKSFRADDYNYKTPPSTSIPQSQQTKKQEIQAERATTRRMTANGAKLHAPEGNNFSRDGGLKRNLPVCSPISSAKKSEVRNDLDAINARKKEEEMYRPLRDELKAFARRYICEETPDPVYWAEKARAEEKEKEEASKQNEEEAKKVFDAELILQAFHRKNEAREEQFEQLVANFLEKKEAMLKERNTNGSTDALTALINATANACKKMDEFRSSWQKWKKDERKKLAAQDPVNHAFDAELEQHLKELVADAKQKNTALGYERDRNGLGEHLDDLILDAQAAWEKVVEFRAWYTNWEKERPSLIAKLQLKTKIESARAADPNSYKRDLQLDHCRKYRVARKCAGFAKQNVEAKEKLNVMAREIDIINKKVGHDVNGYRLSGIPVHIRMLGNSESSHKEMWTDLHNAFRLHGSAMRPSPLRYELGACLEEKARAVAAKAARETAQQALRLMEAVELAEKNRSTREWLEECRRWKRAGIQVRQYRKHRAFPDFKDENEREYFKQAWNGLLQRELQKREQDREGFEVFENGGAYASSEVEMDGMESGSDEEDEMDELDELDDEVSGDLKIKEGYESPEVVMESAESELGDKEHQEEMEGVEEEN